MDTSELLKITTEQIDKTLTHMQQELGGLQIGRASASLVEGLQVEVYGSKQPLKNLANIMIPDSKTIFIEAWDKANLATIEKEIRESSLDLNPNNDGMRIILNIPPLTEERRKDLSKVVGNTAENARITIRRIREDARNKAKQAKTNEEIGEDMLAVFEKKLQEKIDEANSKIDEKSKQKESELMKV
jgi:ribosome recycling factor